MLRSTLAAILTLALPALALAQPGVGSYERVTSFGANPGALEMYMYTPSPAPSGPAPVVLALHGCTMTATGFRNVGWEPLADELGFYVVYPSQTSANNPVTCFNWAGEYGDEANLIRGQGENQSIISMVDHAVSQGGDASRVYITGHSAGAAMVMVMLSTWPDRFAAGGVTAAIPYRCATSVSGAFSCQTPGVDKSGSEWADLVRGASSHAGPWPRLSIWHGSADGIVSPMNATEVAEQWATLMGLSETPDSTTMVDGYPRSVWGGGQIERWEITGAGHANFVDPDNGCGMTGSYVTDEDICSTRHLASFFGLDGSSPPMGGTDAGMVAPGTDAGSWGGQWGEDAGSWGGQWDAGPLPPGVDGGPGGETPPCTCSGGCSATAGAPRSSWAALALLGLALAFWRTRS